MTINFLFLNRMLQNKLEQTNIENTNWRQKYDELKFENKKLEKVKKNFLSILFNEYCSIQRNIYYFKFKIHSETVQSLEKEQNIKNKYEIDYQYMNSLRYTV